MKFLTQDRSRLNHERSSVRANMFQHLFLSEVLKELWFHHERAASVLHAEVDDAGYDVIIEVDNCIRHIQLKSSVDRRDLRINYRITTQARGCVVFMHFEDTGTPQNLKITYYCSREVPPSP